MMESRGGSKESVSSVRSMKASPTDASGDAMPEFRMPQLRTVRGVSDAPGTAPVVKLDAEPLRHTLLDVCEWLKERVQKSKSTVRSELDVLMLDYKRNINADMEKIKASAEDQVIEVRADAQALELRLSEAERKSSEMEATVKELLLKQASQEEQRAMEPAVDCAAPQQEPEQPKAEEPPEVVEPPESPASPKAELFRKGFEADIEEIKTLLSQGRRRTEEVLTELRKEHQVLSERVEEHQDKQRRGSQVEQKKVVVAMLRIDEQAKEIEELRKIADVREELDNLQATVKRVIKEKCDMVTVHHLDERIETEKNVAREREITLQVEADRSKNELRDKLAKLATELGSANRERSDQQEQVQETLGRLGSRLEQQASELAEVDQGLQAKLSQQGDTLRGQLATVEEQLLDLVAAHEDLQDQVNQVDKERCAEASRLQGSIGVVASAIKDRQQAVLFGARCLSCNRVFDEVEPEAGQVDLRREKDKAHVMAEFQRALHSPSANPAESVRMIAVKVGRQTSLGPGGAGGTFAGRDNISPACGPEDVAVLTGSRWQASPSGSNGFKSRGSGKQQRVLLSADVSDSPRGPASPKLPRKEEELPKLSLTKLVDRSDRGGASAAQSAR